MPPFHGLVAATCFRSREALQNAYTRLRHCCKTLAVISLAWLYRTKVPEADKPSRSLRMHASEKEITDQLELLQARAKPPADAPPNIQDG